MTILRSKENVRKVVLSKALQKKPKGNAALLTLWGLKKKKKTLQSTRCWNFKSEIPQIHPEILPFQSGTNQCPLGRMRLWLQTRLICDKNRKILQAWDQRRQQRGCNDVSFIRTVQHFLIKRRPKNSTQVFLCPTAHHEVVTPIKCHLMHQQKRLRCNHLVSLVVKKSNWSLLNITDGGFLQLLFQNVFKATGGVFSFPNVVYGHFADGKPGFPLGFFETVPESRCKPLTSLDVIRWCHQLFCA